MSREGALIKNTIVLAIGKFATQFISFFLLPLYTTVLTTSEFGTYDYITTIIMLLVPICFFQLDQGVFRFLLEVRSDKDERKRIITTVLGTFILQSIIYVILSLILGMFVENEYKSFLVLNVLSLGLSNLMLQITRGLGDNTTYSKASVLSGLTIIILNVLFITQLHLGVTGLLIASCLANLVCAVYIFFKKNIFNEFDRSKYDRQKIKNILKYSVPLIPNQLSWWIITVSDRVIVTNMLGIAQNGIYSVANKFPNVCTTIFAIFNMSWTESVALCINEKTDSKYISKVFTQAMKMCVALSFGIIAFMPFVFNYIVVDNSYSNAYYQIPILMVAMIFGTAVSLIGGIYVAMKMSRQIANTSIVSAVVNIVINILLIPKIGLYAASLSTLIAYAVMTIYRYIDVNKYVELKIEKSFVVGATVLGVLIITAYCIDNDMYHIVMALASVIYAYVNMRKLIKVISNKLFKIVKS